MNIIDNFAELLLYSNLKQLDNFFDYSELTNEEFNRHINLNKLESSDIKELDLFISNILNKYPILYVHIVKNDTKNRSRKIKSSNQSDDDRFLEKFNEKNLNEAFRILLSKYYSASEVNDILKYIEDTELVSVTETIIKTLEKEIKLNDIYKEIKTLTDDNLENLLFIDERKYLANLISFEVFLRSNVPEEYVYNDNFNEVDKSFDNFESEYNKIILNKLKLEAKKGKNPHAIKKFLKNNYLFK